MIQKKIRKRPKKFFSILISYAKVCFDFAIHIYTTLFSTKKVLINFRKFVGSYWQHCSKNDNKYLKKVLDINAGRDKL